MFQRLSILTFAAVVMVTPLIGQSRGGMRPSFSHQSTSASHVSLARGSRHRSGLSYGTRGSNNGFLPALPFFYPDVYSGSDLGEEQYAEDGVPPQVIVAQRPTTSSRENFSETRAQPLVIEWRGDRYVRFGGARSQVKGKDKDRDRDRDRDKDNVRDKNRDAGESSAYADYAESAVAQSLPPNPQKDVTGPAKQASLTVLVYRDRHREEVSNYAIADGVIYIRGDYWRDGYWTRHVLLSALDAPATLRANQQRGVTFLLPSAPNVVIASF